MDMFVYWLLTPAILQEDKSSAYNYFTLQITLPSSASYDLIKLACHANNPNYNILKLWFTGVFAIFSYSWRKLWLWILLRIASEEYPQTMFRA